MTRVRISVEHPILGDADVEQEDQVTTWDADTERRNVQRLLSEALQKINGAYGLTPTKKDADQ